MTLFGKSLFENVLAGIDARKEDEDEADEASEPGIRGLNAGFVGRGFQYNSTEDSDPMHRFEPFLTEADPSTVVPEAPDPVEEIAHEPRLPDWIERLSLEQISEDLDLKNGLTRQQLREKRRNFARENHPDSVVPEAREAATRRMMIANQLIDRRLKTAKA